MYFLALESAVYTRGSNLRTVLSWSHGSPLAAGEHLSTISWTHSVLSFFTATRTNMYILDTCATCVCPSNQLGKKKQEEIQSS